MPSVSLPFPVPPDARRRTGAFWLGVLATTIGVVLHLPMYFGAADTGYRLAGMAPDPWMMAGMVAIVVGLAATTYGLFPRRASYEAVARVRVRALDDARTTPLHVRLLLVMAAAITST